MYRSILLAFVIALGAFLTGTSQAPPARAASNVRLGYFVEYDKATSWPSLRAHIGSLSHVSPHYGFHVNKWGYLSGEDDPTVTSFIRSHGVKVIPLVQNGARYDDFHRFITTPLYRNRAIARISDMIGSRGYTGIQVDFEGLNASDRPYLTSFMRDLYAKLHSQGRLVTMALPAKAYDATTGWAGAYDYAALAPYADWFVIMAYDYHYAGGPPGPISPLKWVRDSTEFATAELSAGKVVLGTAVYGYDWNVTTGAKASSTRFPDVLARYTAYNGWLGYDTSSASGRLSYVRDGQRHQVWYENARSFASKLSLSRSLGTAGVAMWRLGQEDPYVWDILRGRSLDALGQVVDNTTSGRFSASSSWWTGTWNSQRYGSSYRYASPKKVTDLASYKLSVPRDGVYEVFAWWPAGSAYSSHTPIRIFTSAGRRTVSVDQTRNGSRWVYLGTYSLVAGDGWIVQVSRWTWARGYVIADAVKLRPQ